MRGRLVENDLAMATSSAAAAQGEADHNESERKSVSIKKGMRRRARDRGKIAGGIRPYGYRWLDGSLEVVPGERLVVERIFADSIAGASQKAIARALTVEGVASATGKPWLQPSVRNVLMTPSTSGRSATRARNTTEPTRRSLTKRRSPPPPPSARPKPRRSAPSRTGREISAAPRPGRTTVAVAGRRATT